MSRFSRRVPTFQEVFPSSDASFVQPEDVSEVVQLTHPFLATGARFQEARFERVVSAAGVSFINHTTVPEGFFWWVPYWSIRHTDSGANRTVFHDVEAVDITEVVNIENSAQKGDGGNVVANQNRGLFRSILIMPGWRAVATLSGIGAGFIVTSELMRVEYPLAESSPG